MKMSVRLSLCLLLLQAVLPWALGADIFGFPGKGGYCKGPAYMCKDIGPQKCCDFTNLQVQYIRWKGIGTTNLGIAYTGGKCSKKLTFGCGQNDRCLKTEGTSGGSWKKGCADRHHLEAQDDAQCESTVTPNAVSYTDASSRRTFVLNTADVVDAFMKLESLETDLARVEFLLGHGVHVSVMEDEMHMAE